MTDAYGGSSEASNLAPVRSNQKGSPMFDSAGCVVRPIQHDFAVINWIESGSDASCHLLCPCGTSASVSAPTKHARALVEAMREAHRNWPTAGTRPAPADKSWLEMDSVRRR
ncbi:MAG TPA: hypothetical protein VF163_16345 [Micromonosporaceae bacterium]